MAELYRPVQPGRANAMIVQRHRRSGACRAASARRRTRGRPPRDADGAAHARRLRSGAPSPAPHQHDCRRDGPRGPGPGVGRHLRPRLVRRRIADQGDRASGWRSARAQDRSCGCCCGIVSGAGSPARAIGLIGGWPAGRAFAGDPFYLQPLDVAAYVSTGVTLLSAASLAAILPAWRIVRRDPLRALRDE